MIENYLSGLNSPVRETGFLSRIFDSSDDLLSAEQIKAAIPTWDELDKLLDRFNQVFTRHADEEIEVEYYDGSRRKVLFGNPERSIVLPADCGCRSLNDAGARLDMIPFWDEFYEALGEYGTDVKKMLGLFHLTAYGTGF